MLIAGVRDLFYSWSEKNRQRLMVFPISISAMS